MSKARAELMRQRMDGAGEKIDPAPHTVPRLHSFATTYDNLVGTRGVLFELPDDWACDVPLNDAAVVAKTLLSNTPKDCAATGKFVVLKGDCASVFQHIDRATNLKPAWCGNATAAATYLRGRATGETDNVRLLIKTGDREAHLSGGFDGNVVHQSWEFRLEATAFSRGTYDGQRYILSDVFNPYVILDSRSSGGGLSRPGIDQADADRIRRDLLGDRADGKVAIISDTDGHRPLVRFFMAYGVHYGAPMTGLATLSIANLFLDLFNNAQIVYQKKDGHYQTTDLPGVSLVSGLARLHLPVVRVWLWE